MIIPVITILAINLFGFLIAYFKQTDKITDIIYSISFVAVVLTSALQAQEWGNNKLILSLMVIFWAVRLGGYLLLRILRLGRDRRFDDMRPSPLRFAGFWILQTVSILVISSPVLIVFAENSVPVGYAMIIGVVIWLTGMVIESVSDFQKFRFKTNPENESKHIQSGLWRYIRHPNYLGEILVWTGVFVTCSPALHGLEWISALSPVWVFVLLRYISGIPLLEESAKSKYGDSEDYRNYLKSTGRLLPRIWRTNQ